MATEDLSYLYSRLQTAILKLKIPDHNITFTFSASAPLVAYLKKCQETNGHHFFVHSSPVTLSLLKTYKKPSCCILHGYDGYIDSKGESHRAESIENPTAAEVFNIALKDFDFLNTLGQDLCLASLIEAFNFSFANVPPVSTLYHVRRLSVCIEMPDNVKCEEEEEETADCDQDEMRWEEVHGTRMGRLRKRT
jgi:hypothetical protein